MCLHSIQRQSLIKLTANLPVPRITLPLLLPQLSVTVLSIIYGFCALRHEEIIEKTGVDTLLFILFPSTALPSHFLQLTTLPLVVVIQLILHHLDEDFLVG